MNSVCSPIRATLDGICTVTHTAYAQGKPGDRFIYLRLCREREHARWFDTMASSLAPSLRARAYLKDGLEEDAARELQSALATTQQNQDLFGRTMLLKDAGRNDEALATLKEYLRRAVGADPVNHRVYGEWTQFLTRRDRWTEAFDVAEIARARTLIESIHCCRGC
jgi:Tfp pilus assembly protein PilF